MNIVSALKLVVAPVISIGVGAIVTNAVKATTPAEMKTAMKITVGLGSLVVSSFVASKIVDETDAQIDSTVEQIKEIKANAKQSETD